MALREQQSEFARHVAYLIFQAASTGVELTFGDAFRSEDQQILFVAGKTLRRENGTVTVHDAPKRSRTMNSNHLKRLAVDFNFFIDGVLTYKDPKIEALGRFWESLHPLNRWGGFFVGFYDGPHFERMAEN